MHQYSMNRYRNESPFKGVDWFTVVLYLLLVAAGAVSIYAASYNFDGAGIFDFSQFSGKQIRWIGASMVLGLVLLLIEPRMYETYAYPIYTAVTLLLIATIFLATDKHGSRSWLTMGPMSLQPAEFAKFATALALAKLFSGYNFTLNAKLSNYVRALAIIFIPIILILAQKETGSALVFLGLFFVLYREGMSGLILLTALMSVVVFVVSIKYTDPVLDMPAGHLTVYIIIGICMVVMTAVNADKVRIARNLALGLIGAAVTCWIVSMTGVAIPGKIVIRAITAAACLYLVVETVRQHCPRLLIGVVMAAATVGFMHSADYVFTQVLQPHQQMRIKVLLGMENDLLAAGYNVNQSKIAIGSGGFAGKGFLHGTQTKLKYVPEQHTDFIFCTIGEEEGFIGTSVTLLLFLVLILRIISIAERQPTVFGRIYAYCVASYFIVHLCINVGMVIGLCPVIGIPLPFFSYGGSSLWGFTILLFILLRIDASRRFHH